MNKRHNPSPLRVYHGGDFPTRSLDPKWMAHAEANQQEGVGIYFSTNLDTAKRYGSDIIFADIDLDRFVPSRDDVSKHISTQQLAEILLHMDRALSGDEMYYFVTDWLEYPSNTPLSYRAAYKIAKAYSDSEVRHLQNQWAYAIDEVAFVNAWNSVLDFDGTMNEVVPGEIFFAVINPEITVFEFNPAEP